MATMLHPTLGHRRSKGRRPLLPFVPEERLDVAHLVRTKTECLGCGHVNTTGRRFCEVCGRIVGS